MHRAIVLLLLTGALAEPSVLKPVQVAVAHGSQRELTTKALLERILASYSLNRYAFTQQVLIEEGARNHAFPVLTLNARFADSEDDLLASYIHEQVHWHLKEHQAEQQSAVAELRRLYPGAPVGLPEGAETAFSTYGHLVTCYLEIRAVRELVGTDRAAAVIGRKTHYTWIYRTVLSSEARIAAVVTRNRLGIQ